MDKIDSYELHNIDKEEMCMWIDIHKEDIGSYDEIEQDIYYSQIQRDFYEEFSKELIVLSDEERNRLFNELYYS